MFVLSIVLLAFAYAAYLFFFPNVLSKDGKTTYIEIPENTTYEQVLELLNEKVEFRNFSSFSQVIQLLSYPKNIHSGRYQINAGNGNFSFIKRLRNKEQTPVNVVINNIRTKEQLAGSLGKQLMTDSLSIVSLLTDKFFLKDFGLDNYNSISVFISNTYEFYWDVNAIKIFERMRKESDNFWNEERRAKASGIPLTPNEVITLASIVEEETNVTDEWAVIAGLYINRLRLDMLLQADPTVKFAMGDFSAKRIFQADLASYSPYNTYRYRGLPPGPIRLPSIKCIDAVLNYEQNDYLYMCAKESLNGEHYFATTLEEHNENVRKYHDVINQMTNKTIE